MTRPPTDASDDADAKSVGASIGLVLKPLLLAVALLSTPVLIVAFTSPLIAPMLFIMSRRESVDPGWRRAGLVGSGLVVIETALYLLLLLNGS